MNEKKSMLFVINPYAGKGQIKNSLLSILNIFTAAGFSVQVHTSQRPGEICNFVKGNAGFYDYIVCSGGDGTMNETINGVLQSGFKPLLGYIPAGTANDFASSLQIPKNPLRAAEAIAYGEPAFFDVGMFDNAYFTYVAAFGAFTDVSYQTPQDTKNRIGKLAYFLEGATRINSIHSNHVRIEYDGGVIEENILAGVITNSKYVAGMSLQKITDSAMDDGIMEIFLVKEAKHLIDYTPVINAFISGNIDQDTVMMFKTRSLKIDSEDSLDWSIDGEYGGSHKDVSICNLKCALRLMLPAKRKFDVELPKA